MVVAQRQAVVDHAHRHAQRIKTGEGCLVATPDAHGRRNQPDHRRAARPGQRAAPLMPRQFPHGAQGGAEGEDQMLS